MKIKRFLRSESGSYSVEAVLMFPLLMWALAATFVFWDAFKLRNNALAATYAVADMVSRQTQTVDDGFLGGLGSVYRELVGTDRPLDMRVTVMRMDAGSDPITDPTDLALVWSHGSERLPAFTDPEPLTDKIPRMAVGATLIMVDTKVAWVPPLSGILDETDIQYRVFASPRFVPQIAFDDGAGDDGASFPDDGE